MCSLTMKLQGDKDELIINSERKRALFLIPMLSSASCMTSSSVCSAISFSGDSLSDTPAPTFSFPAAFSAASLSAAAS